MTTPPPRLVPNCPAPGMTTDPLICQIPGCGTPAELRPERNNAVLCRSCCLAVAVHAEAMVETLRMLAAEGRYAAPSADLLATSDPLSLDALQHLPDQSKP